MRVPHLTEATLVLFLPPQHGLLEGFSSGLIALASFARLELPKADIRLADLSRTARAELKRAVRDAVSRLAEPLFVGITTTTATYQSALRVARFVKALRVDAVVVLGGHHAGAQARTVLDRHHCVDFVVRGEGERSLVELVRSYPDVAGVPNLCYRNGSGESIANAPAPFLQQPDLDRLPPYFSGAELVSAPGKFHHTTYVSARGCPLRCSFCAVANQTIRYKSVSAIIHDLEYLVMERGATNVAIEDNFFTHSPARTFELCAALEAFRQDHQLFHWDCQTRVESLTRPEVVEAMARAGCQAVYVGVEAFHPESLVYLGKTHRPARYLRLLNEKVVPELVRRDIRCYLNLQLGLPGETRRHCEYNLAALAELGAHARRVGSAITIFPQLHVVYPGTSHWVQLQRDERFGPPAADLFEDFTAWEDENEPLQEWLGRHFAHGTGGVPLGLLDVSALKHGRSSDRFVIDAGVVMAVQNHLDEIASVAGVELFSYGPYLVAAAAGTSEGVS